VRNLGADFGTTTMSDEGAVQFMKSIGLCVPERLGAHTAEEAISAAESVGYPVALKLDPSRFRHKSDFNGVILSISDEAEVRTAFDRLAATALSIDSTQPALVTVEAMVPPGLELILAVTTDELFGRSLMLGFGGVLVELVEDFAFRLVPLSSADAFDMIASLRGEQLLTGYRGQAGVDVVALSRLVVQLSEAVEQEPSIYEVEFNPIIGNGSVFTAVDWNIGIAPDPGS
jgi:acetate---CoA ligase (ADP-forming)